MKKIILPISVCIFALISIALVIMYNMGDRLIEEAIRSELLSIDDSDTSTDIQPDITAAEESTQAQQMDNPNTPEEETEEVTEESTPAETEASSEPAVEPSEATASPEKSKKPSKATPSPVATQQPVEVKTELTTTEINEIKDEVSAADKIAAAALVLKRLSTTDINELKSLLADGISDEDRAKAKEIAYSRFTEEEITKIKEMYEKYMK